MHIEITLVDDADGIALRGTQRIRVEADPVPQHGVVFFIDDKVVITDVSAPYEHTWDTTQTTDGTHKLRAEAVYKTRRSRTEIAVTVFNAAPPPPPPPPPDDGATIPAYEVVLQPGWRQSEDPISTGYNAVWLYPTSPTTPYRSPDSFKHVQRYLLLDPRYTDTDGRRGNDEWWMIMESLWPADFNPANAMGGWNREENYHNVAGDAGPNGGVGWGFGAGSSALALDWDPTKTSPSIDLLSTYGSQGGFDCALPVPTRDEWHTYVLHFIAGRTDGTTPRQGAAQVWADGQKVLDRTGLNTVQRAQGPDGPWYVQRWMQLWEGMYCKNISGSMRRQFALTRIGRTFPEAVADRPTRISDSSNRQVRYAGSAPAPTLKALTPRPVSASKLPVLA